MTQSDGTPIFKAFSIKWIVLLMDWSWFWGGLKVLSPPPADCTGIHEDSVVVARKLHLEEKGPLV